MSLLNLILACSIVFISLMTMAANNSSQSSEVLNLANDPSIKASKQAREKAWLQHPDVVSVGIGLNQDKQPTIIIGVKNNVETVRQTMPTQVHGHPVEVRQMGEVEIQSPHK